MNVQPCNNYNNSFGSKVIVTTSANKMIKKIYKPGQQGFLIHQITELENNGKNDVVVIDACHKVNQISMTCYWTLRDKFHKSAFPSKLYELTKSGFENTYTTAACKMKPVRKSCFDKYNPLWDIIKSACKAE